MGFDAGAITSKLILSTGQWDRSIDKIINKQLAQVRSAINKTSQTFNRLGSQFSWTGAAITAATGLIAREFIHAASVAEQYSLRLKVLLGSAAAGIRLFDQMADYASRVPFELEKIMESATFLSGVMKGGSKEVTEWMPLIGDLAAATGFTIREVTGQVIRMYSAGAAAADLFRERGILGMLGFQVGVTYTAEETKKRLMEAWEEAGSKFKGATDELAKSWAGMISMMIDKWFLFRIMVMDTGIFDILKFKLNQVEQYLRKNWEAIGLWVKANADSMVVIGAWTTAVIAAGAAILALGLALKIAAFSLLAFGFILSPVLIGIATLGAALYALRAIWLATSDYIIQVTNTTWSAITKWIDNTIIDLDALGKAFRKAFTVDYKLILDVINNVIRGFTFAGVLIGKVLGDMFSGFRIDFKAFVDSMTQLLNMAFNPKSGGIFWIENWRKLGKSISKTFTGGIQPLTAGGLDDAIKSALFALEKDYVAGLVGLKPKIVGGLTDLGSAFAEGFSINWDVIKAQFGKDFDALVAIVDAKMPFITGLIRAFGVEWKEIEETISKVGSMRHQGFVDPSRFKLSDIIGKTQEDLENKLKGATKWLKALQREGKEGLYDWHRTKEEIAELNDELTRFSKIDIGDVIGQTGEKLNIELKRATGWLEKLTNEGKKGLYDWHRTKEVIAEINEELTRFSKISPYRLSDLIGDTQKNLVEEFRKANIELENLRAQGREGTYDFIRLQEVMIEISDELTRFQEKSASFQITEGFKSGIGDLYREFSNFFQMVHTGVVSIGQKISTGLTGAIMGVITRTKSATQAFQEFGLSIVTALIQTAIQMAINFGLAKLAMIMFPALAVGAAGAVALAWAPAAALVSLATAGANAVPAMAGITATMGLAGASAGIGSAFSGSGGVGMVSAAGGAGFASGIEDVPYTGYYKLHENEKVIPRYDAQKAQEGEEGGRPLNIHNLIVPESVALAMASDVGRDTIINIIDMNSLEHGRVRRVVRRG